MGAGNSTSSPAYGVALNPRLEYTNKISKQKQEVNILVTFLPRILRFPIKTPAH